MNQRDYNFLTTQRAAQLEKLNQNKHKPGFDALTMDYLERRILDEIIELYAEIDKKDYAEIRKEVFDR